MLRKVDHIGIAVKDLETSVKRFALLLGVSPYKTEEVDAEGVSTVFFQVGDVKIELLGATRPESPVAKFLEKRGEGIHHIAFQTDGMEGESLRLESEGFPFTGPARPGAEEMLIRFLHPSGTHGVLTEICQPQSAES